MRSLFLFYLRIKPLLYAIAYFGLLIIIYNQFINYRHLFRNNKPWTLQSVSSGNSLFVMHGDEIKKIKLCGIEGGNKEYLESLLDRGNGSLIVNSVKKIDNVTTAEVFVPIKPDYEREIHLSSEMIMFGMATINNPDICPSSEYLKMAASNRSIRIKYSNE